MFVFRLMKELAQKRNNENAAAFICALVVQKALIADLRTRTRTVYILHA
jgi:hypothetical protein